MGSFSGREDDGGGVVALVAHADIQSGQTPSLAGGRGGACLRHDPRPPPGSASACRDEDMAAKSALASSGRLPLTARAALRMKALALWLILTNASAAACSDGSPSQSRWSAASSKAAPSCRTVANAQV